MSHPLNRPASRIGDAQSDSTQDLSQARNGLASGARRSFFLEPQPTDEFVLVAKWHRSVEALVFYVDALIEWAPIEVTDIPIELVDEHGTKWQLCRLRYSGPLNDRDRLIANAKRLLNQLMDWIEPEILLVRLRTRLHRPPDRVTGQADPSRSTLNRLLPPSIHNF